MKLACLGLLAALLSWPQVQPLQKAVALAASQIYISPDTHSTRMGQLRPGEVIGVQDHSGAFTQVFSGVSGWITGHDFVALDTPGADEVIFGAATALEAEAQGDSSDTQTAQDAARLYLNLYGYLPQSPRAGEALYRGASIQWQLKMAEEPRRRTPEERIFPDDSLMRKVISKFKNTPWAARAEYQLLAEHFTCGDWFSKPECIGKEVDRYQDYVKKYPRGPMSAEAAYDAVYREGIAWTIYSQPGKNQDAGKAEDFARKVAADAARLQQDYPGTDWAARAALVAFQVARHSPLKLPGSTPLGGP